MNDGCLYAVVGSYLQQGGYGYRADSWSESWAVCWRGTPGEVQTMRKRCQMEAESFIDWEHKSLLEGAENDSDWDERLSARRDRLTDPNLLYDDKLRRVNYTVLVLPDDPRAMVKR